MKKVLVFYFLFLTSYFLPVRSQQCYNLNIRLQSEIPSVCSGISMTMIHDQNDRPYLYVANKEAGLKIYDITDIASPKLVKTVPVSEMNNLDVMNVTQDGSYLYLALGNHFSANQYSGMSIVDISDPAKASVTGKVKLSVKGGGGIIKVSGNYAILGAMMNGLYIFDISDKKNIKQVSVFIPDINFPDKKPDAKKINARGMAIAGDIIYLCYDAGGVRAISISDKAKPYELGRYSNPVLNNKPRAYNNIVIEGSYAYITFDYCGLEVLNISDPKNMTMVCWWNPYNCQQNPFGWFSSPGHLNEIDYNPDCKLLFISSGKSDLLVLNVSNPAKVDSCGYYGGVDNNMGTWGVSTYKNRVFLSYVCAFIPFASNWTGVKILTYDNNCKKD